MTKDEQQIRDAIQSWMAATKSGDIETLLDLMTDDVVFMVAGQEPFGKAVFYQSMEAMKDEAANVHYDSESHIEEIKLLGDWAYVRIKLRVTTVSSDTDHTVHRAGYTLTIFRKEQDGKWRLARDANLLAVQNQ